jgi:Spy/CpxP family protein refolding chaperone
VSTGSQGFRVVLLLLVTFAAGAAAGIAIDRRMVATQVTSATRDAESNRRGRQTTIERFADELGLTEDQRARIAPILVDTRARMSEMFDRVRPEYDTVVDSARSRIEEILTPEQVRMYRELLDERRGDDRDEPGRRD